MTKWNSADRRWKNSKRGNISVLSEGGGQGSEWQRRGVGRMERRGMWVCAETSSEMSALEGTGGIYCKQYSKLIDTMINLNMTFADLFKRSNLIITPWPSWSSRCKFAHPEGENAPSAGQGLGTKLQVHPSSLFKSWCFHALTKILFRTKWSFAMTSRMGGAIAALAGLCSGC